MSSIVSDPNYGQIQRKCGLEVGECYNKPASENNRIHICPPEKEQVIMDAFRYFGMI